MAFRGLTMADKVASYLAAYAKMDALRKTLNVWFAIIRDMANHLDDWKQFTALHSPTGFPTDIIPKFTFDVEKWPSGEAFARTLTGWHFSHKAAEAAYKDLTEPEKVGLRSPEE